MELFLAVLITLALLILLYVKWSHTYWTRIGLPHIPPDSIFGNFENPLRIKDGLMFRLKNCYDDLKRREERHGGIYFFTQATYLPIETNLIKSILTTGFPHFPSRGFQFNDRIDPLSAHVFNLEGEKWKDIRAKLAPTFTSGRMKMMFKTLLDCGVPMIEHIDDTILDGKDLDIKEILACYTTDIIGSCAFGLECNSFKDPNAEFRTYGRKIFTPKLRFLFLLFLTFVAPKFVLKSFPLKRIPMDVEKFFIDAIKNVMDYRTANAIRRNDFIQLFLEIQEKAKIDGTKGLTLNEICAQAFVFFIAGFETSATTMTFCLHELAFNQDIQDKLRDEIREGSKKNDGLLTYDSVTEMKYMDKVINETLRKYPPIPILNRRCAIDYKIPDSDLTLKAGTNVFISVLGLHRDEEYYPEPDKFNPERFNDRNGSQRPPFTFLPFGEGPRTCMGIRFGLMQTKTGLSMLLRNYRITPAKDEPYDIRFDPKSFVLTKKGAIMLRAEKVLK